MSLSSRFDDALAFASNIHRTQFRKGSDIPYIAHLLAVSAISLEHGASENQAIAALLHDAVEDQGGASTLATIRARFDDEVAEIVAACTDTDASPKPPWRQRKERYIAHLDGAPSSVRLVVAADKLHNVRSILADHRLLGSGLWPRFTGGRDGTLWFYRAVADALKEHCGPGEARLNALVTELDAATADLEQIANSTQRDLPGT